MAQKAPTVETVGGYDYTSSAYRVASETETGSRFEVRCNDPNISPWSTQMRIGGTCLLLAAMQIPPIAKQIRTFTPPAIKEQRFDMLSESEDGLSWDAPVARRRMKQQSQLHVMPDGSIKPRVHNVAAVDFQERLFTLFATELNEYTTVPDSLQQVIYEGIVYCQDFRKVLSNDAAIETLADRSDMAAKIQIILASMRRRAEYGNSGFVGDINSQYLDMMYDYIGIEPNKKGGICVRYGSGFKLRDQGHFRMALSPHKVEHAYYRPPTETRAYLRGELIRRRLVDTCSWSSVAFADEYTYDDDYTINLGDVLHHSKSTETDKIISAIQASKDS